MTPQSQGAEQTVTPRRWRSIFISDVHLGTRGCNDALLLDFLKHNDSEALFLVGDLIDGWRLKKSWYWSQGHNDVFQKILRKGRKGTRIIYLPGNHDEFWRDFLPTNFGDIEIVDSYVHTTADDKKLLVIHGDQYDAVMRMAPWLAHLGDTAYTLALQANTVLSYVRRKLGLPYWSLSNFLKQKAKGAVKFVDDYEQALARAARERGCDGVVCGHIHKAQMREIDGVLYCNDGDWVESCTALVEDFDGSLHLITWQLSAQKL